MDAYRKNTNYTLTYNFETSPKHKAFMDASIKQTNYTLRNIQFELVSEYKL